MITIFGIIMTACFFIPSIIPSICVGSANGFAGASVFSEGAGVETSAPVDSWVYRLLEREVYRCGGSGERVDDWRRSWDRRRARLVRSGSVEGDD
jgi:hypothetical protein